MTHDFSKDEQVTPYQDEVLTILNEECAEVVQRACKSKRFGPHEIQPGQLFTNAWRLGLEVGDLLFMIELAKQAGLINEHAIAEGMRRKPQQLATYMRHQPDAT